MATKIKQNVVSMCTMKLTTIIVCIEWKQNCTTIIHNFEIAPQKNVIQFMQIAFHIKIVGIYTLRPHKMLPMVIMK